MMMIRGTIDRNELAAGLIYIALGLLCAGGGLLYDVGTPGAMGPGFMPVALGTLTAAIGVMVSLNATRSREAVYLERWDLKRSGLILLAVLAFALLLNSMGLIVAIFAAVLISGPAANDHSIRRSLITAGVLSATCVVVFVLALKLQLPLLPGFVGE